MKCLRLKRMPGEGESEPPRFMASSASSSSDLLFSPQPSHRAVAAADCEVLSLSPFAAAAAVPFA